MSIQEGTSFGFIYWIPVCAILVAIGIPVGISYQQGNKLDNAATNLASLLQFARNEGMRTGQSCRVEIDAEMERVRMVNPRNGQVFENVMNGRKDGSQGAASTTRDCIDIVSINGRTGFQTVVFNKNGLPATAGLIRLQYANHKREVFIHPVTGIISVQ